MAIHCSFRFGAPVIAAAARCGLLHLLDCLCRRRQLLHPTQHLLRSRSRIIFYFPTRPWLTLRMNSNRKSYGVCVVDCGWTDSWLLFVLAAFRWSSHFVDKQLLLCLFTVTTSSVVSCLPCLLLPFMHQCGDEEGVLSISVFLSAIFRTWGLGWPQMEILLSVTPFGGAPWVETSVVLVQRREVLFKWGICFSAVHVDLRIINALMDQEDKHLC